MGKPAGKILLGILMCRQKNNVKIGVKEIGWTGVDRIHATHGEENWWPPVVNTVTSLRLLHRKLPNILLLRYLNCHPESQD